MTTAPVSPLHVLPLHGGREGRDRLEVLTALISAPSVDPLFRGEIIEQWRLLAEGAPDDATADYLHRYFEPTARAIDGLEKALAGLGLLDEALALDLRKPQDYFHRVWSTAFRAADLVQAATRRGRRGRRVRR